MGYEKLAATKKKENPLDAELEHIYKKDPKFNEYASLAKTELERKNIKQWFESRRRSEKRAAATKQTLELQLAAN